MQRSLVTFSRRAAPLVRGATQGIARRAALRPVVSVSACQSCGCCYGCICLHVVPEHGVYSWCVLFRPALLK